MQTTKRTNEETMFFMGHAREAVQIVNLPQTGPFRWNSITFDPSKGRSFLGGHRTDDLLDVRPLADL